MEEHYESNLSFWSTGYEGQHPESFVFRGYSRYLEERLPAPKDNTYKMLDFGCGGGGALNFYHHKGFHVCGVDISAENIDLCEQAIPERKDYFKVIDPKPKDGSIWFDGEFNLVTAYQSLYYVGFSDFQTQMKNIAENLVSGGYLIASLASTKHWFYENSTPGKDGLRNINIHTDRISIRDYYMFFLESEQELLDLMDPYFTKLELGYYDAHYREDEGSEHHYLYLGQKK